MAFDDLPLPDQAAIDLAGFSELASGEIPDDLTDATPRQLAAAYAAGLLDNGTPGVELTPVALAYLQAYIQQHRQSVLDNPGRLSGLREELEGYMEMDGHMSHENIVLSANSLLLMLPDEVGPVTEQTINPAFTAPAVEIDLNVGEDELFSHQLNRLSNAGDELEIAMNTTNAITRYGATQNAINSLVSSGVVIPDINNNGLDLEDAIAAFRGINAQVEQTGGDRDEAKSVLLGVYNEMLARVRNNEQEGTIYR